MRVGAVFTADRPIQELAATARAVEASGFDELWVWEDSLMHGGIAQSSVALAATSTLQVGLGVMPAPFRNPIAAAMEIATLADLYPGRFVPGFGHGLPLWMAQAGALPRRPLIALEETTVAVRRLLHGEEVDVAGEYVRLDRARLVRPPAVAPPLVLGVRRARGLELSGRIADGTVIAEWSGATYLTWARERITVGRTSAGRLDAPHRLTLFVAFRIDRDRALIRQALVRWIVDGGIDPHLEPFGMVDELRAARARGEAEAAALALPDSLLDEITATGDVDQVISSLAAMAACGVDTLVLVPFGPDPDQQLRLCAEQVLPAL